MADVKRVKSTPLKALRVKCFTYYPSILDLCFKGMDRAVREAAETINKIRSNGG